MRHAEIDGCRVILDVRTESYRVLDPVGSAMWSILTGESDEGASLKSLAATYETDLVTLRGDLEAFAKRCIGEQLLVPKAALPEPVAAETSPRRRRPGLVGALTCLIATQRALSRDGFGKTYERYGRISATSSGNQLTEAVAAFAFAENFFVARRAPDDCLPRSLALYRFLRECGLPVRHVIGVSRFPFLAHAWVEHAGAALLDDRAGGFTPLARLGAAPDPADHGL